MSPIHLQKISNLLYEKHVPLLPQFITLLIRLVFSCFISHKTKIGKNTILGYGGLGIVIHERAIIGNNCHIDQNVTIGGTSKIFQVPVIGNNVYIGAGAKVIGPVKIGNNIVIGANAVVVKDIPDNCLVAGIPGKILKTNININEYM